ncbi:MAG: basic amino acid/polyamine antiporter [Elusimicrobiota bacterium]|nr:basic amino acid/polyamine antiporter [Elusimicrobiota bacterium]
MTEESETLSAKNNTKLGVWTLAAVAVSAMVGSGVFSLPQNMAQDAGAGAVLLAWVITGAGMFCIASTFCMVARLRPRLTAGLYSYAQDGFGRQTGFLCAWGYWLCNIFANTGYAVILMEALNHFFPPHFEGGNNLNSFILSTAVVWAFALLSLRGIKTAAAVNFAGTVCKFIPILIFVAACAFAFRADIILPDIKNLLFGRLGAGEVLAQVKGTMMITLWCFVGIESAAAISGSAARGAADVPKITLRAFAACFALYVLISVLPFGIMPRAELASLQNPSTAGVLEHVMGKFGMWLMVCGLILSVLFSWMAWFIIASDIPYAAAKGGAGFPARFTAVNGRGAPAFSIMTTAALTQAALVLAYFSEHAWNLMISITGVMVMPVYLITALYLWKLSAAKDFHECAGITRRAALLTGIFGAIYALWLIYAANIKYLLTATAFYAAGIPVYLLTVRKVKK